MPSLKGIMFNQFANEGMSELVVEMQSKYKPKKGRRFNHNNITYEIGRPVLGDGTLEFEISSKVPQDEVQSPKDMKSYFAELKKVLGKERKKPKLVDMENIIWDSRKDSEKERDYIKVVYEYSLEELYDSKEVDKRYKALESGKNREKLPDIPSVPTILGKLVLLQVKDKIMEIGRNHIATLINANKIVRDKH